MATTPRSTKRRREDGDTEKTPGAATCKTCAACRRKKTKCDSGRPACRACVAAGSECIYVEDTRRLSKPSWPTVQRLEASVANLWERLQQAEARAVAVEGGTMSTMPAASPQVPPSAPPPAANMSCTATGTSAVPGLTRSGEPDMSAGGPVEDSCAATELSPQELSVVGLVQSGDGAFSVHGASSLLHATKDANNGISKSYARASQDQERERSAAQARLVSNAALQRQREFRLLRTPRDPLDLDGLDVDTATHLLDLHWNRQHYAYLLTYRPAVMDSLYNGGPWANKLLLNAIYYSSSVYSDRACFTADGGAESRLGLHFYSRFKALLVDAVVEPSITSAAALLLMGSNMASQGNLSAGWNFCGLAYRMIVDVGGHLMTDLRRSSDDAGSLQRDVEREMRKRIFWGAFIIDTTQSLYFGRPASLPLAETRVPTELLDTYEELEEWTPYVDPTTNLASNDLLLAYTPHPAYAVSTFSCLARLFRIGSRIIRAFYSLESVRLKPSLARDTKACLERDLSDWRAALPENLNFNPDTDPTPPPHQINPHTSYHALIILLKRPFSKTSHLQHCSSIAEKTKDAMECVESAVMIWKLVAAYRNAFTLRRAAYLVVYAMYSAVVVLLADSRDSQGQHSTAISFFWSSLSEQRQWFAGLHKPLAIIRDTMNEYGQTGALIDPRQQPNSAMQDMVQLASGSEPQHVSKVVNGPPNIEDIDFLNSYDSLDYASFDFLEDHEKVISDDALFGLFAPLQDFT